MSDNEREELNIENISDVGGKNAPSGRSDAKEHRSDNRHHSHKHHSKAYYKYRKIKHKAKKAFRDKKYGIKITAGAVGITVLVGLIIAGIQSQNKPEEGIKFDDGSVAIVENAEPSDDSAIVKTSVFYSEQVIADKVVEGYMSPDYSTSLADALLSVDAQDRLDISKPVCLEYTVSKLPEGVSINNVRILVSESSDLSSAMSFDKNSATGSFEIVNLKVGTKYYYSIDVYLSNEAVVTTIGSFKTASTPRIITVNGTANVRDIGGWTTKNGSVIRQGLLYRGAEIDGAVSSDFKVTDAGINTLVNDLQVVCDFDLRGYDAAIPSQSPLGAEVKHLQFGAAAYNDIFSADSQGEMRSVFSALADSGNYPMYLHCSYGMDRTGTVCYVLEALLGLSDEDLIKEYELSCLYYHSLRPRDRGSDFMQFVSAFNELDGASSQDRAQNYLLSIGVTQSEINSIKDIFLG